MNLLETDGVALSFSGRMILNNVYLSCQTGELVGLVGRNGSGKSCLMQVIFGTLRADHQSVRINKRFYSHPYRQQAGIAYLPQDGFLPGYLSFEEVVSLYRLERHMKTFMNFEEVDKNRRVRFDTLSGGLKKLMEVLTILYMDCRFLLLDEPFSFLAPSMIEQLLPHIEAQRSTKGMILTDHMYRTVLSCCDRICLVRQGILQPIKEARELIDLGYLGEIAL